MRTSGHTGALLERRPSWRQNGDKLERLGPCWMDQRLMHSISCADSPCRNMESGTLYALRTQRRRGGTLQREGCAARTWRQYSTHTALRTQFRIYGRRPVSGIKDGRAIHQRSAEQRCGSFCEALRTEQSGAMARTYQCETLRTCFARDISAGIPRCCRRGRGMDIHGLIQ